MSARTLRDERRAMRPAETSGRDGFVLALIVTCQLMIVLDATVVNVALPPIQEDLGFSATGLSVPGSLAATGLHRTLVAGQAR